METDATDTLEKISEALWNKYLSTEKGTSQQSFWESYHQLIQQSQDLRVITQAGPVIITSSMQTSDNEGFLHIYQRHWTHPTNTYPVIPIKKRFRKSSIILYLVGVDLFSVVLTAMDIPTGWAILTSGFLAVNVYKFFRRKKYCNIEFSLSHLIYQVNNEAIEVRIPYQDIYQVREEKQGLLILDKNGAYLWYDSQRKHTQQVIIPLVIKDFPLIKSFLSELAQHNQKQPGNNNVVKFKKQP